MAEIAAADETVAPFEELYGTPSTPKNVGTAVQLYQEDLSPVDHTTTYLFCSFLGMFGAHHFYAEKPLKGIATILTFGGFMGIWPMINSYQLLTGSFRDGDGKFIRQITQVPLEKISDLDVTVTYLFTNFFGWAGIHQFYADKPIKGILMLLTGGGLGIWNMINTFQIATGSFKDGEGKLICPNYIKERAYAANSQ